MNSSKKSYEGNKSQRSKGRNEDNENIKELKSSSKSKHSSNIKLSEKRERPKEDTKEVEKAHKKKKISESEKEFIEVNEMSTTLIGREIKELKKEMEEKQKRLNYLEIYEKIKNEMNKEMQKAIFKESKNTKCKCTKVNILNVVKEVSLIFYKKKKIV